MKCVHQESLFTCEFFNNLQKLFPGGEETAGEVRARSVHARQCRHLRNPYPLWTSRLPPIHPLPGVIHGIRTRHCRGLRRRHHFGKSRKQQKSTSFKLPKNLKQNGAQKMNSYSDSVFYALSRGVIRFIATGSSRTLWQIEVFQQPIKSFYSNVV